MDVDELQRILQQHKTWLKDGTGERANLRNADLRNVSLRYEDLTNADLANADLARTDLRYTNLRNANLRNANLDFSSMPLWCGDLKANYDDRQIIQQLYHVLSHAQNSSNASEELKQVLLGEKSIVNLANKFHRVEECGEIERSE